MTNNRTRVMIIIFIVYIAKIVLNEVCGIRDNRRLDQEQQSNYSGSGSATFGATI